MKQDNYLLIPERLVSARDRLNLSKAEAARQIGLTAASYVRYEAGDRRPSPQVVMTIAEKQGTSVAFMVGETDDVSPRFADYVRSEPRDVSFQMFRIRGW